MAKVQDVANFFIDIENTKPEGNITNMKLNKLMYFAQGLHLARYGTPLFDEEIQAWQYGPVVPSVYRKYNSHSALPIINTDEDYDFNVFTDEELEILIDVERTYGIYEASALVSLTHQKDTPWYKVYVEMEKRPIIEGDMKEYFSKVLPMIELPTPEKISVLPQEWYDPEDDKAWGGYAT